MLNLMKLAGHLYLNPCILILPEKLHCTEALTSCMECHIPKIKLKSKFQPIWYDSECH